LNEENNLIFKDGLYILEEDELFIYPNSDMTSLNIFSAGTILKYGDQDKIIASNHINITAAELDEAIYTGDVVTFEKAFKWNYLDTRAEGQSLKIIETVTNNIIEGTVTAALGSAEIESLTTAWEAVTSVKVGGNEKIESPSDENYARVSIMFNIGSKSDTKLPPEVKIFPATGGSICSTSEITYYINANRDIFVHNDMTLLCQPVFEFKDGEFKIKKDSNDNIIYEYNTELTVYEKVSELSETELRKALCNKQVMNEEGEYSITIGELSACANGDGVITLPSVKADSNIYITFYHTNKEKMHLINLESTPSFNLTAEFGVDVEVDTADNILVSKPFVLTEETIATGITKDKFANKWETIKGYDPVGEINRGRLISAQDKLNSFLDSNNVYNPISIASIDFDNTEIKILGDYIV